MWLFCVCQKRKPHSVILNCCSEGENIIGGGHGCITLQSLQGDMYISWSRLFSSFGVSRLTGRRVPSNPKVILKHTHTQKRKKNEMKWKCHAVMDYLILCRTNKSKYLILYRHTRKTGKGQANISPFSVKSVVFYPESMRIQAVRYMSPVQYIQNFKVIFTVNKTVNKLFAMSQIMLVALALKIRFSMSLEKMYTLS